MSNPNDTADELKKDIRETAADLRENARQMASDTRAKLSDLADSVPVDRIKERGAEMAEQVREKGHEYAEQARAEARRLYQTGQRRAHDAAEHAEEYYDELTDLVRRRPAAALGIAAGVGFLVGLLLARR